MKNFWNGLAGVAKALIIGATVIILGCMLSTCTMFGVLVSA